MFARFGSRVLDLTVAVVASAEPGRIGVFVRRTLTVFPLLIVPSRHVVLPPMSALREQVVPDEPPVNVFACMSASRVWTTTTFVAADGPLFFTTMVLVMLVPTCTDVGCGVFVTLKSADAGRRKGARLGNESRDSRRIARETQSLCS